MSAGAWLLVDDAGNGRVTVRPTDMSPLGREGYEVLVLLGRPVACATLSLDDPLRHEGTALRERAALGFGGMLLERELETTDGVVALSVERGGPPFLRIGSLEYDVDVFVITEEVGQARVLIQDWTGTIIVGWTSAESFADGEGDGGGGMGLIGGIGRSRTDTVCTHTADIDVVAVLDPDVGETRPDGHSFVSVVANGSEEPVGSISAGIRFVRVAVRDDGRHVVAPHRTAHFSLVGEGVALASIVPDGARCVEETYDPRDGFLGCVQATLNLDAGRRDSGCRRSTGSCASTAGTSGSIRLLGRGRPSRSSSPNSVGTA